MAYDDVLASRIEALCPMGKGKKMFGGYGFFLSGKMFAGVMGDRLMVKLGDQAEAAIDDDVEPFSPGGKSMSGWVTVPQDLLAEDEELDAWLVRGQIGAGL